jgi:choline dehydrogenase-like flavoprotein
MLSGIGPKDELEMLNIPCLVDSPGVGKNLQVTNMTPWAMQILS